VSNASVKPLVGSGRLAHERIQPNA
jgi:hypothetical protein